MSSGTPPFTDIHLRAVLPIHNWILQQLEESKFEGLKWLDVGHKIFKIIWPDVHQPEEQNLRDICEAWERNKRKGRSEKKNDFSTMKKKLYDALRQCNYIDPVKDLNKNSQQTGNYKAFKFLNKDETEAKKNRRKKSLADSSKPCFPPSESGDIFASVVNDEEDSWQLFGANSQLCNEEFQNNQPEVMEYASACVDSSFNRPSAPACLSSIDPIATSNEVVRMEINGADVNPSYPTFVSLEDMWKRLIGLNDDEIQRLGEYEISIRYENNEIYKNVLNLNSKWMICPALNEHVTDANIQRLYLPFPPDNPRITTVLNHLRGGLTLKFDSASDLIGLRCCNSYIYYLSFLNDEEAVKLETGQNTPLFSYWRFIEEMLLYRDERQSGEERRRSRPKCEVMLVFGTMPKSAMSKNLISMFIKPVLAERLCQSLFEENSVSLCFSTEEARKSLFHNFQMIQDHKISNDFGS